ncbi:MAG: PAS domain S-box protein [Rhodocyclaceae bacterium]
MNTLPQANPLEHTLLDPPVPADEAERVAVLHELGLLETTPEPAFDRTTRVLAQALDVPIALISLIDARRQVFKSRVGVNVAELPRELTFCSHTILGSGMMVVPDATADPRFKDNPLVVGPQGLRFYAGVPIRTVGGLAIGTISVIDTRPRQMSAVERQTLFDLADTTIKDVQLRESLRLAHSRLIHADSAMIASETRFRSMFELASVGIALVAPDGGWVSVNQSLCQIVGYEPAELSRLTFQDLTHPEDLHTDLHLLEQLVAGEIDRYRLEKRYIRKDGKSIWIELSVTKKVNTHGRLEYFVSIIKDIQAQKEAEEGLHALRRDLEHRVEARTNELLASNRLLNSAIEQQIQAAETLQQRETELRAVIEHANDAYVSIDETGLVTAWNREAERTFGWTSEETLGKRLDDLIMPVNMGKAHRNGMARYLGGGQATILNKRLELPALRKDGTGLTVEVRIHPVDLGDRNLFCAFMHDISDRKEEEVRREHEARHDVLTGLLNRRALSDLLPLAQMRADRSRLPLAVLFVDLDGFKLINDAHGHEAGDVVLRTVAERLRAVIRRTDTVVRLAGDEFTLLLEGLRGGAPEAERVAGKVLAAVAEPMLAANRPVQVGASIGVVLHEPGQDADAMGLLRRADAMMYAAKTAGKNRICVEATAGLADAEAEQRSLSCRPIP